MPRVESVNIGHPQPNPHKRSTSARSTGIGKQPVDGPVQVRDPGPKTKGLGSGLVGDFIGDGKHHGGNDQAVYAFQREDLDAWQQRLGRDLPNGYFGENLTTTGIDVNDARIGERWRIGERSSRSPHRVRRAPPSGAGWGRRAGSRCSPPRPPRGVPEGDHPRHHPGRRRDRGGAPPRPRRQHRLGVPGHDHRPGAVAQPAGGRGVPRSGDPRRASAASGLSSTEPVRAPAWRRLGFSAEDPGVGPRG